MANALGPLMADVKGLILDNEERDFLCHPALGAIILFSRNFASKAQVADLIGEIKSLRDTPLLIAVDQEGGRVQRFRDGFFALPPLLRLGDLLDRDVDNAKKIAFKAARLMALELRLLGLDFSFAPVLDTANPVSQIIGDRGLHLQPEQISVLAHHYIEGMHSAGMAATGKHFPGHGGVVADSHLETPVDNRTMSELDQHDMQPYHTLSQQLDAVMTAHIHYPRIDADLPTFSSYWIKQILREKLGFDGLVFSDDLSMQGAVGIGTPIERSERALTAGCDMVLICNDPDAARTVANHLGDCYEPDQRRLEQMRGKEFTCTNDEIAGLSEQVVKICT